MFSVVADVAKNVVIEFIEIDTLKILLKDEVSWIFINEEFQIVDSMKLINSVTKHFKHLTF